MVYDVCEILAPFEEATMIAQGQTKSQKAGLCLGSGIKSSTVRIEVSF